MDTPLGTNWKKEDASIGEEIYGTIYRQLVGSLNYLVNIRPDIVFTLNHISKFMVDPTKLHWKATKHVLRYLRGTTNFSLWYRQTDDVDWAGSPSKRKSTLSVAFNVGSTTIYLYNKKQRSVTFNLVEVEYMAST